MNAEIVPFRTRAELECLRSYRRLSPREQRAYLDALMRMVDDGQPAEASCTQMLVQLGDPPAVARRKVREELRKRRGRDEPGKGGAAA